MLVDTAASGSGIAPTFEYSDGVASWVVFTPIDGTNGFKNTGAIIWDLSDVATWAVGTGSEYLVRITRTRNSLSTVPIIDEIQVVSGTEFGWDKDAKISVDALNLASLTASEIVITDGSKNLVSAPVATYPSLTELTYVKGVTSAIQTQIDAQTMQVVFDK